MPITKAHKTRHHSNLRPKHKHNKQYLQVYWPYLPLLTILIMIVSILQPWAKLSGSNVLPYATSVSINTLLDSTNQQRQKHGIDELKLNSKLNSAAQAKASHMVKHDYWAHNTPDGKSPWVFVIDSGYDYQKAGENLAYGFLTSQQVVTGWMNSSAHRSNLLDATYREVGFGFADSANFNNSGPSTVVVAMYATPNGALVPAAASETTPSVASYSSLASSTPNEQTISRIQNITRGVAPWVQYLVGMVIGGVLTYLGIKHSLEIRRALRRGERFALRSPLLDITLLALGVLGVLIIQKVGVVL